MSSDRKEHVVADPVTPMKASIKRDGNDKAVVRLNYIAPAYKVLSAAGKVVDRGAAETVSADVTLQYIGDRWKVTAFGAAK